MAEVFVSTTEAAAVLGISERRLRQLLEAGRVPGAQKIGNAWAIPLDPITRAPVIDQGNAVGRPRKVPLLSEAEMHRRALRTWQRQVAVGILQISTVGIRMQARRLHVDTDRKPFTGSAARIEDAHYWLISANQIVAAIALAARAESTVARAWEKQLGKLPTVRVMRDTLEHLVDHAMNAGRHQRLGRTDFIVDEDSTILQLDETGGPPVIVMPRHRVSIDEGTELLVRAGEEVQCDILILNADVSHTFAGRPHVKPPAPRKRNA